MSNFFIAFTVVETIAFVLLSLSRSLTPLLLHFLSLSRRTSDRWELKDTGLLCLVLGFSLNFAVTTFRISLSFLLTLLLLRFTSSQRRLAPEPLLSSDSCQLGGSAVCMSR